MRQNKATTLEVVHNLMEGLGEEYLKDDNDEEKGAFADMAVFVLVYFLAALRGEEILKISLGDTRDYFE